MAGKMDDQRKKGLNVIGLVGNDYLHLKLLFQNLNNKFKTYISALVHCSNFELEG